VSAYTPASISASHPYIASLRNEFATKVPIFMRTGTLEALSDDHVQFAKAMKDILGNRMEFFQIVDTPQDTFAAGLLLGFVKEAEHAADVAAQSNERRRLEQCGKFKIFHFARAAHLLSILLQLLGPMTR